MSDSWRMEGDPCPKCGSTSTYVVSAWKVVQVAPKGRTVRWRQTSRRLEYTVRCRACGHKETKHGQPSRE
jgi:hypothetical protein